jgi:hypothetical protein
MKIDNNDQIMKSVVPEHTTKSRPSGAKEFGTILKETVENTTKTDAGAHQTAFIRPLSGVRLSTPVPPDATITLEHIENMIDLLDQYRHKLADPRIPLRQIDEIINKIEQQNDSLATIVESTPDDDEIKNILNQTRITASLEVAKFYRGDYLPA